MSEKLLQQILAEISGIKSEVSGIKSEMSGMNSEISGMKSEISGMKSEISGMKSEISSIKSQLDENTQIIKVIRDRQEETDAKLENLAMDVHHMRGDMKALTEAMAVVNKDLAFTSYKTMKNEKDIFFLRESSAESISDLN